MEEKQVIPKTLEEAINLLIGWNIVQKAEILSLDEDEFLGISHHQQGRWIRNNWKFWAEEKSDLKDWFNSIGITHPDDMSGIILTSFYRTLKGEPINLDIQVEGYKKYWSENS